MCVLKMEKKSTRRAPDIEHRTGKRYLDEMRMINSECGGGEDSSKEDPFYPKGPPVKKGKGKVVNLLESEYWKSALVTDAKTANKMQRPVNSGKSLLGNSREGAKSLLLSKQQQPQQLQKQKPKKEQIPRLEQLPELPPLTKIESTTVQKPSQVIDSKIIEEAVANIPGMSPPRDFMFEEDLKPAEPPPPPPCPSSYFVLLRERFRTRPGSKITIPELEDEIEAWQRDRSDRGGCQWLPLVESWKQQIPSAVAFLTGAFPGKKNLYARY